MTFSKCLISQLLYTSVLLAVPPLKFPGSLIDRSQTYNSDDDTSVITQSVTSSKIPLNGTLNVCHLGHSLPGNVSSTVVNVYKNKYGLYGIEKNNQTHLFVLRDFCNNFRGDSGVNL